MKQRKTSDISPRDAAQTQKPLIAVVLTVAIIAGLISVYSIDRLIPQAANAQEDREFVSAEEISNEEQGKENENGVQSNPNGISQRLEYAHFIPMSPVSNSPGNQLKILLDYAVDKSSPIIEEPISAVMEVYASNGTLLRTSSLPEPLLLDKSEGTIQLATTFDDKNIRNVTAVAILTDETKGFPISDPLETRLSLGERTAVSSEE